MLGLPAPYRTPGNTALHFRNLFSGGSYMAHVTYISLPGCLLLDPSLYPSLALRRLKLDISITDVAFAEGNLHVNLASFPFSASQSSSLAAVLAPP